MGRLYIVFCIGFVRYVYIRLHTLIIGVSRPLHHNIGRNSKHKRITDKCTPSAVRADHLPFFFRFFYFLSTYIIYISQFLVDAALTAHLLDIYVHFLVGDDRESLVSFAISIPLQDCARVVVKFYCNLIIRFLCCYVDSIIVYVCFF